MNQAIELADKEKPQIISLSIRKTSSGNYYTSILCETENRPLDPIDKSIGIDVGIKNFLVDSNNKVVENPKYLKTLEKKLKYNQRQLSKKVKGSKNRNKQRIRVALLHEKISNQRQNFLHQLSRKLINENQVIISEDLDVVKMMKNNFLANEIGQAAFGEFFRQLDYKSRWSGRTYYQIDKFFPSSKTCNHCKYIYDSLSLREREWTCLNCKKVNDRDLNAAKNILEKGLKDLSELGTNSDIKEKLAERLSLDNAMKQEVFNSENG
jgi:putative transposase